jgi:hypothetical protein
MHRSFDQFIVNEISIDSDRIIGVEACAADITPLQFQDIKFRVSSILVVVYSLKPLSLRG